MDKAARFGCVACRKEGHYFEPAQVHHITSGFRRMGHLFTIPLCSEHHKSDGRKVPSIHHQKRTFVTRYGSELDLLAELKRELGVFDSVEYIE